MPHPALSLKALAFGWGGLVAAAGSGALALQLTDAPPVPAIAAPAAATPMAAPAVVVTPLPATTVLPVPFQNHSLLTMLPPPVEHPAERAMEHQARPVPHVAPATLPLPLPPVPVQRTARVEPAPQRLARAEPPRRAEPVNALQAPRPAPVYVAEPQPAYPGWGWGRPMPYPGQYASARQYYGGPRVAYGGWQPYD